MNYPSGGYPPPQWNQPGYPQGPWQPAPRKSGPGLFVVLAVLGIPAALCTVAALFGHRLQQQNEEAFGPLRQACGGVGVPVARPYIPGPANHLMVALERGSSGDLRFNNYLLPQGARSENITTTDLVVCMGDEQRTVLQQCTVTQRGRFGTSTSDYDRVQLSRPVRVIAAATGQVVVQGALQGAPPRACVGYSFGTRSASDYVGASPGTAQLGEWFQQNGLGVY